MNYNQLHSKQFSPWISSNQNIHLPTIERRLLIISDDAIKFNFTTKLLPVPEGRQRRTKFAAVKFDTADKFDLPNWPNSRPHDGPPVLNYVESLGLQLLCFFYFRGSKQSVRVKKGPSSPARESGPSALSLFFQSTHVSQRTAAVLWYFICLEVPPPGTVVLGGGA